MDHKLSVGPSVPRVAEVGPGDKVARFKNAMSRFAAAVNIITTGGQAGLGGITASAATSVSTDPPTMLFCMNKSSISAARIIDNGVFCINTLSAADAPLSDVFAGRTDLHLEDRFASGDWTVLATGSPVLVSAVAAFDCRILDVKDVATHLIVIGAVEAVAYDLESSSLCYLNRAYRTL